VLLRSNIFSFDYDLMMMLHSGIAGHHSTARERIGAPPALLLTVGLQHRHQYSSVAASAPPTAPGA